MNLSYWELDTYFKNVDYTIVGSGIVGLSTAFHLRKKNPTAKIIILEKGSFPSGGSTKNAGFACFGSISEIIGYLQTQPRDDVYDLVNLRYSGLQKLRNLLGDEAIGYKQLGGYEVYRKHNPELWEESNSLLKEVNEWLCPIFQEDTYSVSKKDFGFQNIIGIIETKFEGQIHTGEMMRSFHKLLIKNDVPILNSMEVTKINDTNNSVNIRLNDEFSFTSKKVFICTNGFARSLIDLDVQPARGQVLITKPIKNLQLNGNYHIDRGFYYFRNVGDRVLLGGARNIDIEGETTAEFGITAPIQEQLESYLRETILPGIPLEIEHRWSGIMGMGKERKPIIKQLSENTYCGVRLSGIGVAIGTLVGEELAGLVGES